jgi:uncharacterized repeat protein (TIGR01451 family)
MKKLLLTFALFFSTSILLAQNFNQPSEFNNVCDDNNDGIASFWLGEITYEILGNLNPQDYAISHHETQADAAIGVNPMPSPYMNINPTPQEMFARIVNVLTNEVTILTYNLNVNLAPPALTYTVTNCANGTGGCWDLTSVEPMITQGLTGMEVHYYRHQFEAQANFNEILAPACYATEFSLPPYLPVFYRVDNMVTGCSSVGMIQLVVITCENPNCPAPAQLAVTNITQTSAIISWTDTSTETSWNIAISANGTPFNNIPVQQNPFVISGLSCDTNYVFSVTANCGNSGTSTNSVWAEFTTGACSPQPGQPINLAVCGDNAFGCFDITTNDNYIIGNLNPSEYTISYHLSQVDADNNAAAILAPMAFCAPHGSLIYARLENNTTTVFQTFAFALIVETFSNNVIQLNDISQCDTNNDSVITFNLTSIQTQVNSGNTLEYYPSLSNAQNQAAPFTNPSAVNIGVQNSTTNVFVREILPNGCDNIYSFQLLAYANCNLGFTCEVANSLCNALGSPFANTTGNTGPNPMGCLASTPNPTWFYLPISSSGAINLQINQISNGGTQIDVDYIVHGPFTSPTSACADQNLLANNIISCSFSAAAVEYPIIPNAQAGQFYLIMVTNYSGQAGLITISELSSSTGTIDCSGLRLNAFLDSNNNGTQEIGEQNFPLGQFNYEVNNNGNVHNIVSPGGTYNIYDDNASNAYDLSYTINPNYIASYGIITSSYSNVHVVVGAGVTTYNFPITVTQAYNDLAVNIIPVSAPRPGFTYINKIVYSNNGNQTVPSGTVTFNHDAHVSITANTQAGTTPITNGFTYNFTNLLPFESREIAVTMQVATIPTVTIGGLLTNTASIIPLTGDVVPANNSATNTQVIIGSYDPNDKMEAHGGRILYSAFTSDDYLTYTIRFENSGTANAENVRVNDLLDSGLDETTIRMISASHPYIMDRIGSNVNWLFNDIQLPPSVENTNIGKGYITFKVKPRAGYAIGDIIPNTASIYFDFNPAIVTNSFNTEFVAQLGVGEFENADFVFYPNPVLDIVTIKVKNNGTIANMAVYDVSGKMIMNQKPTTALSTQTLDLSSVSKGMYLLEVTTDSNLKAIKKLIVE